MECSEFKTLLQQRLDARLAPRGPELHSHAETCPDCSQLLLDAVLLSRGVAAWRASLPVSSGDLTSRIVGQVLTIMRAEQSVPQTAIRLTLQLAKHEAPHIWHTWALLAGTVAAVWFVFIGSAVHQQTDRMNRRVVTDGSRGQQSQPQADLGAVLVSAEGAYSQLATESLLVAQDLALLWPASSVPSTIPPPAPGAAGLDWSPEWSRELAPISDSVEDAWDFLRRAMPQVSKSRT